MWGVVLPSPKNIKIKEILRVLYTHMHILDMSIILKVVLGESRRKHEKIPLKRESVESEALECSYATLCNPSKEAQGREVHTSTAI